MLQVAVVSIEGFVADEWAEWTLYTQSAIESFHPICDDVIPSHPLPGLLSVSDWILWRGLRRTVIFPGYHFNHHRQRDPDYNRPTTQRPSNHHHARQQEPLLLVLINAEIGFLLDSICGREQNSIFGNYYN